MIADFARRHATKTLALAAGAALTLATGLPATSAAEQTELAARFHFAAEPLGAPTRPDDRRVRTVAPAYERIKAWVSSVGAATALFDADGEPVANDVCLVDPRSDTVTVQPAPGTPARYPAFRLTPPDLLAYQAPMGCVPADLNEDGRQDLLVYYWGRSPSIFLRRAGGGYEHRYLTGPGQVWNTNAATVGDYDGDGHLDLVFGNYFPDGARVLDPASRQSELVMASSLSNALNGGVNRIFRYVPESGSFEEAEGVFDDTQARAWTLALGTQDVDADGRPDLYVANDFSPDQLLVNESKPGRISFREATGTRHAATPKSKALGRDSFKGMGVAFTDLNADRIPDILVSNITEDYALHESNFAFVSTGERDFHDGHAPYDDQSEDLGLSRTGWSWDVKAADFDGDGADEVMHATGFVRGETDRWAQLQETALSNDLILAHPGLWPNVGPGDDLSGRDTNTFFTRTGDGPFTDVAKQVGVGTDAVSRGFAVGDVEGDGRLDFVVANQWAPSTFYRNESPPSAFLGLRLRLPAGGCAGPAVPGSTPAIGATATVGGRVQQLYPANGHGGVSAPELFFGGVSAKTAAELTWRDRCGRVHQATTSLAPGWRTVLLTPDGRATEVG